MFIFLQHKAGKKNETTVADCAAEWHQLADLSRPPHVKQREKDVTTATTTSCRFFATDSQRSARSCFLPSKLPGMLNSFSEEETRLNLFVAPEGRRSYCTCQVCFGETPLGWVSIQDTEYTCHSVLFPFGVLQVAKPGFPKVGIRVCPTYWNLDMVFTYKKIIPS